MTTLSSRKHHVERNTQLLRNVNVSETWRVRNNGVSHKGLFGGVPWHALADIQRLPSSVRLWRRPHAVTCFNARSPAPQEHLLNSFTALCNFAALQSVHPRHEPWVLDHKGHKLRGIATDAEELEAIFFHKRLEIRMRRNANSMAVRVMEHLAKSYKRLDIPS